MFSFRLSEDFVARYNGRPVPWGFTDAGGNSLGELTFIRTYSRVKPDGMKESWVEVCERVINGMYSIQKDHCKTNRLPWNDRKAQASAQEAFERLFELKWTPPGRGLWMMGTEFVMDRKNAAALQNCGFISTADIDKSDPGATFSWVMDALMLGVGIGFDTLGSEKGIIIKEPSRDKEIYQIPDTREGWAESLRLLINSYLRVGALNYEFDYSRIRPMGDPIAGFGGTASGPQPLIDSHIRISKVLESKTGQTLDSLTITDIMNLIGTCVVAGNVRRSAELALGQPDDENFIHAKDHDGIGEYRQGWSWMSNNSLSVKVGQDYERFTTRIADNGEPGFVWLDLSRSHGRLVDPPNHKDRRVAGYNPCAEQSLESYECCTLVELHLGKIKDKEDYLRTLKFAYLYGKTVTLLPTHWDRTNAVMQRNRRIGTSMTGIAGFSDVHGIPTFREWANDGYNSVQKYDEIYSEWLCVRPSIKTTTVKPSGSVSILSGSTPGVHWTPGGEYFLRAIRFSHSDPTVSLARDAGYTVEDDVYSANTSVVYFPVKSDHKRSEQDVSIFEKIHLAVEAQRWWSDNAVSVTVSFKPEEKDSISTVLKMYEGQLKTVSFLPMSNDTYEQMPYQRISEAEYNEYVGKLQKIDTSELYLNGSDPLGDKYCTTDVCELPQNIQ